MSKKWRIFFKVLYYVLTFSLGIMIAVVLPNAYRDAVSYELLDDYIEKGEYVKAIDLLGGIYNKEKPYYTDEEHNFVIYETNTFLDYKKNKEDEEEKSKKIITASYVCIITGLEREHFELMQENKSKVLINETEKIDILQSDLDGDGTNDTIATLIDSNYLCFTINQVYFTDVNSIELIKADGTSVFKLSNLNLDFSSVFHNKTKEFVTKYNEFYEDGLFSREENETLENIYTSLNQENPNYQKSGSYSLEKINNEAVKRAMVFVLIYFLWVYILADFLVGQRYIIRFFKFIYRKIKPAKEKEEPLALGKNFYSSVTFELVPNEEMNGDVIVSYAHETNSTYNFKCIITKASNYKKKERIHGGIYKLVNVECPGYEVLDLPEKIEVKGYTMEIKFKVNKGIKK